MTRPLILTLALAEADARRFDELRRDHTPARYNRVPAHLTLFHALPGEHLAAIETRLGDVAQRTGRLRYRVSEILDFGGGCAFGVEAPALDTLHKRLRQAWADWLTPQDAAPLKPHVTVQRQASRESALALISALRADFSPWEGVAPRLDLWHYDGGPWDPAGTFEFKGQP